MQFLSKRLEYLFRSTRGLTLVAIAVVSIITAIFGTLSGPMVEWGVRDITVNLLGMKLVQADREGRIIMLYHTIAMTVVAIEVYFMTEILPMKRHEQVFINATITVGYLTAVIFGLLFGYLGHNFAFHGLFLVGQSLVFFAGILLVAALWPWKKEYRLATDSPYAHTKRRSRPGAHGFLRHGAGHPHLGHLGRGDRLLLGQRPRDLPGRRSDPHAA